MANATSAGGQPRFISTAPPPSGSPPSSQTADRQRDLPHELLVQIIQYAAPPLATIPKDQRRRRRPLRRCALVNKAWHAAALDEAVQHLFINLHEGGWSQSEEEATKRIKALKERAADRGRNVKTLALFGEKALPTPSADALRNSFDQVTQMSLTKMKKPLRLLGGMQSERGNGLMWRVRSTDAFHTPPSQTSSSSACMTSRRRYSAAIIRRSNASS